MSQLREKLFSVVLDSRVLGFALFLLLFGLLDFPSISPDFLGDSDLSVLVNLFPAGYVIPILLATVFGFAFPNIPMKALIIMSASSLLIGLIVFMAELLSGSVSTETSIIPLFGFGIGITSGFAYWLLTFEQEDVSIYIGMVVAAHLIEALVQLALFPPLHPLVLGGLLLVLIIANVIMQYICSRNRTAVQANKETALLNQEETHRSSDPTRVFKTIVRELWQPLLCVMVIGFSLAVMRSITSNSIDFLHWSYSIPAAGKLLGVMAFAILWLKKNTFIRSNKIFYSYIWPSYFWCCFFPCLVLSTTSSLQLFAEEYSILHI